MFLLAYVLCFILKGCSGSFLDVTLAKFPARLVRLLVDCHVELREEKQPQTSSESALSAPWCPGLQEKHWKCPSERREPARDPLGVRATSRTSSGSIYSAVGAAETPDTGAAQQLPEPRSNSALVSLTKITISHLSHL